MTFEHAYIPFGAWWSSPFVRWQGSIGDQHAMKLAAECGQTFFSGKDYDAAVIDGLVLGITVHQKRSFYGAPWLAGMIGAPGVTGPMIGQACATSVRCLLSAAQEVETGLRSKVLTVTCDRTSNGPHVLYPNPKGIGGMGETEDPVWDNFNLDPWAGNAMIDTAENVAAAEGITKEEQDAIALMRYEQYQAALADDRAFQKRYMVAIDKKKGRKVVGQIDADEGVFPTTAEGLAGLKPAKEGGTVSFGSQTHPADGNAGMMVTSRGQAEELGNGPLVQILGFGEARVEKGFMPKAVVPAAMKALEQAALSMDDVTAIKTHNPFAINDAYFAKTTSVALESMNNYGCSLVYGHPQAPTGQRGIIELLEELGIKGGGVGLFSGCAAGDSAMAMVVKVG